MFAVLPFFQPVEREEQRVVAVVLEAGGDGGDVQQIVGFDDDEARENDLTNVHFVGFKTKEQLEDYYRAADLFVLPTREDIWGLVVAEAMAYGLGVITTNRCNAGRYRR